MSQRILDLISELSKKTLGSYHQKATVDSYEHSRKALDAFSDGDKEKDDYHFKKMNQREIGKIRAAKKGGVTTTNESSVSINEAHRPGVVGVAVNPDISDLAKSGKKYTVYFKPDSKSPRGRSKSVDISHHETADEAHSAKKAYVEKHKNHGVYALNPLKEGKEMSAEEYDALIEDFDQLDELSKRTLASYVDKADKEELKALQAQERLDRKRHNMLHSGISNSEKWLDKREELKAKSDSLDSTIRKRRSGIKAATTRLNKESKEMTPREKDLAADGPNLPPETEIWQKMNPDQKAKVMEKVGSKGSVPKTHRACMDHIRKNMDHYKKQLDESVSVGDKVVVQTVKGKQEGVVNDVTNTHVGVRHPGTKGVVHYHPEYVKKKIAEEVDETLIEGVSWERWDRSHGSSKGMSKSNRGQWMVSKHQRGYQYGHKEGEDHITVDGTGKDAAEAASKWAKEKGHHTVYVLESFLAESQQQSISFGAIVNSALTTSK